MLKVDMVRGARKRFTPRQAMRSSAPHTGVNLEVVDTWEGTHDVTR